MTINDRFKEVRKALGLTQAEFGSKLVLKQNSIGLMEQGARNLTDRTVQSVCKSYNVNEDWLRNGGSEAEMFCAVPEAGIVDFANSHGLDKDSQFFLLAFAKMDEKRRGIFLDTLKSLVQDVEVDRQPTEAELIEMEVQRFREELLEEKRVRDASLASGGTSETKKQA